MYFHMGDGFFSSGEAAVKRGEEISF